MSRNSSACIAEACGTFMLCFIGAGVICTDALLGPKGPGLLGIAIAHGLALSIGVSATMNVSGGHLNPAVTLAMLATGRSTLADAIRYIISQLAGAMVAGLFAWIIFRTWTTADGRSVVDAAGLGTPNYDPKHLVPMGAIIIEAFLTFLLVFAVFGTAVDARAPRIGGFGIGLTIAADILVGGPLTGAAMNPARTFGPGVIAFTSGAQPLFWSQQVVYWAGPIVGGLLAGLIYHHFVIPKDARSK